MQSQWIDGSTDSVEFYCKELPEQTALVFRRRRPGAIYNVCIAGEQLRCTDTVFTSLAEAQAWAEQELGVALKERAVGR